jgi:hypothetical protein
VSKPSVAVMLGMPKEEEEGSEDSLAETRARAEDAAGSFAAAVAGKDPKKLVKAFCALQTLCGKLSELEDSGESDEEEAAESPKEEADETEAE